jgi:transcriptional regulator with XRE-family HTH domain
MAEMSPDPIDVHVGVRLRRRRRELAQSQTDLANALGVSVQQVQKYERGSNRISASMMHRAAIAQRVEPGFYFGDLTEVSGPDASDEAANARSWLSSETAWRLAMVMAELSPARRNAVVQLAQDLSNAA